MIKKAALVTLLVLSFIIAGCGNNQVQTKDSAPVVAEKTKDSTEVPEESTSVLTQKTQDTAASQSSIKYQSTPVIDMNTYFNSKDRLQLQGTINNKLGIHMELHATNKTLTPFDETNFSNALLRSVDNKSLIKYEGIYYYDGHTEKIRVEAKVDSSGYISIAEFDKNNKFNGAFGGFISSSSITGMWSDKDSKISYPFYIIVDGSQVAQDKVTFAQHRIGSYKRNGGSDAVGANLIIYTETEGKFKFTIDGYWHYHTGSVDGVAVYTDKSKNTAKMHYLRDDGKELDITFVFNENSVDVSANDLITEYGGANVSLLGSFKKI